MVLKLAAGLSVEDNVAPTLASTSDWTTRS